MASASKSAFKSPVAASISAFLNLPSSDSHSGVIDARSDSAVWPGCIAMSKYIARAVKPRPEAIHSSAATEAW